MTNNLPNSVIAVFERRPYWGPELQRQFQHADAVIRECRAVVDLLPSLAGFQSALMVIDLDSAIEDLLNWIGGEVRNQSERWPIIACGSAATVDLEWLLREAGVTAFLPEVVSGDNFARLCRRQLGFHKRANIVE